MPSSSAPDDELSALVELPAQPERPAPAERPRGNTENGERIFSATCGSCHASAAAAAASVPTCRGSADQSRQALRAPIREPSASFAAGYEPVTLVTRDGQRIRGAAKSEDAFSIQIMDTRERLQGYLKSQPARSHPRHEVADAGFGPDRLNDDDLDDLLRS